MLVTKREKQTLLRVKPKMFRTTGLNGLKVLSWLIYCRNEAEPEEDVQQSVRIVRSLFENFKKRRLDFSYKTSPGQTQGQTPVPIYRVTSDP